MKIGTLKDLENTLLVVQHFGISSLKVGDVEIHFENKPRGIVEPKQQTTVAVGNTPPEEKEKLPNMEFFSS